MVSSTGFAQQFVQNQPYLQKPKIWYFQPQIKHWRRRVGKNPFAQNMMVAININGASSTGFALDSFKISYICTKPNIGYFQPQIKHWRRRVGKNLTRCTRKQILRSFILRFFRRANPIFHISYGSWDIERCLNTTFGPKHRFLAIFGHYMPHLPLKLAEIMNFAGDS